MGEGVGSEERSALFANPSRESRSRYHWGLTAFFASILVTAAVLFWGIAYSIRDGNKMFAKPVGAGAGTTGGANAIGELLAGHAANASARPPTPPDGPAQEGLVALESLEDGFFLIVQDKSGKASPASPIHVAGNFNNWNPGDPAYKLEPQSDMRWRIRMPRPGVEKLEFKFTRGTWELEELDEGMNPPTNRTLERVARSSLRAGEPPKVELVVHHWGDERASFQAKQAEDPSRAVRVGAGTLRRLQVHGGAGDAAGRSRDLLVWLPPGYDDPTNAERDYPVLYLHDGQNLFEKHAGIPAEWRVDEVAGELIARGEIEPLVIVGIPHSGKTRVVEYLPPVTDEAVFEGMKPQGAEHVAWLMERVMPRVERAFRVRRGASSTGIGGSSMGGLIALYASAEHPDVFGLVLAESPALGFGKDDYWRRLFEGRERWGERIFLGVGGREGGDNQELSEAFAGRVKAFRAMLAGKGLGNDRALLVLERDAVHDEAAWARRLPGALKYLYQPGPAR